MRLPFGGGFLCGHKRIKMKKAVLMLAGIISCNATAQQIEEIQVIGQSTTSTQVDVNQHFTINEALLPTVIYTPGGIGGFASYNERGAQTIHTAVYKNGVPANDPSNGWYDFAHDTATGNETVTVMNGPNGVLYGSGSLGGTVFLNDSIGEQTTVRLGSKDHYMVSSSLSNVINFNGITTSNGSVRSDNTEEDSYRNIGVKTMFDVGNFTVSGNASDYSYDYDDCWTASWLQTNDCVQQGQRLNLSARNDNLTVGYNRTDSEYFSGIDKTWESTGERYFVDLHDTTKFDFSPGVYTYGVQYENEKYAGESRDVTSAYVLGNFDNRYSIGVRYNKFQSTARAGFTYKDFRGSVGTSYRLPTLYEINGDSWVAANSSLEPEKATGVELGYKFIDVYRYEFKQGIDYDFTANQFVNTGEYVTQGVRFNKSFNLLYGLGKLGIFGGYTDTTVPRVPKYKTAISYSQNFPGLWETSIRWVTQYDKGVDYMGTKIDDVNTFEYVASRPISKHFTFSLLIQDVFDNNFEIVPGYNAGGRRVYLTINYK